LITSASKPLIAIVDDDESVCRALRRLVRSLGMSAESFSSGQEFIDVVEAMPLYEAACVVLDVRMQGLSGLEVQERLIHGGSRLPVIFITAHDDLKEREGALAAGAVAYLRKPFNDELFIKTLRVALSQSQ
jgi:FixJ family two-component response regulator